MHVLLSVLDLRSVVEIVGVQQDGRVVTAAALCWQPLRPKQSMLDRSPTPKMAARLKSFDCFVRVCFLFRVFLRLF